MKNRLLKNIILIIISLLITLFFLETIFKIWEIDKNINGSVVWPEINRISGEGLNNSYIKKDNGLSYKLEDDSLNEDLYILFDKSHFTKTKPPGVYRIAIVGDSYTWIPKNIDWIKFYAPQLTEMLSKEKTLFEVLPFAQPGLNTEQEFTIIKELALSYNPNLVILQSTNNDNELPRASLRLGPSTEYVISKSEVIVINNRAIPAFSFLSHKINLFILQNSSFLRYIAYNWNVILYKYQAQPWQKNLDTIKEIKKITEEKNIDFLVIFTPSALNNPCAEETIKSLGEQFKSLSEEIKTPILNLCDNVLDFSAYKAKEGDGHYNTEGYKIVAEALKNEILKIIKK
ncbi:MAG TPA: hypothetical protein P5089_02690 [Candidatus Portnoybacteria bacterium]|nr:hypothetical protein [Candidatus Portnoybacteria bacterium]